MTHYDLSELYPDLNGVEMSSEDLSNVDLAGAKLRGANLNSADLFRANLTGADLTRATLDNAHLRGANLTKANLADADLAGANLTEANLAGANLTGADLCGANLAGANLTGANLCGATLTGANLAGAQITPPLATRTCYKRIGATTPRSWPRYWPLPAPGVVLEENICTDQRQTCASGIHVGTWDWCQDHYPDAALWECEIPEDATVIVPYASDGKWRVSRLVLLREVATGRHP